MGVRCTCMFCMCFEYQCSYEEEGVQNIGLCYRRFHRVTIVSLISRFDLEWGLFLIQQGILKDNNLLSFDCDSKAVKQWVVLSVRRLLKSFICGFICVEKISVNNVLTFEHTLHRICIFELLSRNLLEIYWQFHCISVSLLEPWKSFYSRLAWRMNGWLFASLLYPEVRSQCEIAFNFPCVPAGKGNCFHSEAGCCSWRVTCVMISFSVPGNTHFTFCQNVVYKAINVL